MMKQAIARSFSRAAQQYDCHANVQRAAAKNIIQYLADSRRIRDLLLDIGCGTGYLTQAASRFAIATIAADIASGMLLQARGADTDQAIAGFVRADVEALGFGEACFDAIISSFVLQWCDDLTVAFAELYRVLKPEGELIISIPVAPTLHELQQSWLASGSDQQHVNPLPKPQQVVDALAESGFDRIDWNLYEHIDQFASVHEILHSIKGIGAQQIKAKRSLALTGKGRYKAMVNEYERLRAANGLLPVTWRYVTVVARRKQ